MIHPLPTSLGEGEAVVKLYRSRRGHNLVRRLRTGRARLEGEGYRAFEAAGIRTPRMLFYFEERRLGLHRLGVVATVRLPVLTVTRTWRASGDEGLFLEIAGELALVHAAGLAHGDPITRNFLATRPRPTIFDLATWGKLTPARQEEDIVRHLGSVTFLLREPRMVPSLLERYSETHPLPPLARNKWETRARSFAASRRHWRITGE